MKNKKPEIVVVSRRVFMRILRMAQWHHDYKAMAVFGYMKCGSDRRNYATNIRALREAKIAIERRKP